MKNPYHVQIIIPACVISVFDCLDYKNKITRNVANLKNIEKKWVVVSKYIFYEEGILHEFANKQTNNNGQKQ